MRRRFLQNNIGQHGVIRYECVAQWIENLTLNGSVVSLDPIQGSRCFLEQDTLPSLFNTGWSQELIGV